VLVEATKSYEQRQTTRLERHQQRLQDHLANTVESVTHLAIAQRKAKRASYAKRRTT
jgi:hypothetical protein